MREIAVQLCGQCMPIKQRWQPRDRSEATERQIRANGQNALKSTRPRTAEGKSRVAFNALKHGLLAERVVLPTEDEDEFAGFRFGLEQKLEPVGELRSSGRRRSQPMPRRLRRLLLRLELWTLLGGRRRGVLWASHCG